MQCPYKQIRPPAYLPTALFHSRNGYFGYLNSGADFSASLDTVENLASAGALPVVFASSAKTGLARTASEAAIKANFFMSSSSEKYFTRTRGRKFSSAKLLSSLQDAARRVSS